MQGTGLDCSEERSPVTSTIEKESELFGHLLTTSYTQGPGKVFKAVFWFSSDTSGVDLGQISFPLSAQVLSIKQRNPLLTLLVYTLPQAEPPGRAQDYSRSSDPVQNHVSV